MSKWEDNEEIQIFREYLRIPSVHPNPNYEPCVQFLERQAKSLDLPVTIYYPVNKQNPIVVLSWVGSEPNLPSIVLNSHMDVVPVFPEFWTHPPFAAEMDADGKIFARGAQDMKCVGVQYLAAIRALKRDGIKQLKRSIHVMFVPDEELGGQLGMAEFVTTKEFKALNVGFSLDEGVASPTQDFIVYNAERTKWEIEINAKGQAGHGMLLLKNTAGEKLHYVIGKFLEYRKGESEKLEGNPKLTIGDVTTVNLTMILGGTQGNVVPPEMSAVIDCRIANDVDLDAFEQMIHQWCKEAGNDVSASFRLKFPKAPVTAIDATNPYWVAFKKATDELNLQMTYRVFPGATDSRFIRLQAIPAIGFSPMNRVPILLHDHDEYLPAQTYLTGIDIYKKIITNVANV